MDSAEFLKLVTPAWIAIGAFTFLALLFITAPYGRHTRPGWGPTVGARLGWVLMEVVSPLAFVYFFLKGNASPNPVTVLFLGLFVLHYANRAVVYPFRMRGGGRPMPASIVAMGALFNTVNGFLNGRHLNLFASRYPAAWLLDFRFLFGLALFAAGMYVNLHSDGILRTLRSGEERDYKIPRGGFFELVSCPNYFGELLEWLGWACLTWSLAGLTFAVWTAANLVPRAVAHHRWYQDTFPDYPDNRKAIIPFLL